MFNFIFGRLMGKDEAGNKYYQARWSSKRWVVYKGLAEPSKVPATWHRWLHYSTNTLPTLEATKKYSWQKPHVPNLTGTAYAYLPPGHLLVQKSAGPAPYTAWDPTQKQQ